MLTDQKYISQASTIFDEVGNPHGNLFTFKQKMYRSVLLINNAQEHTSTLMIDSFLN